MAAPKTAKQWLLNVKPTDMPVLQGEKSTFKETTVDLPSSLPADSVLVKTVAFSNDPAQRAWISGSIDEDRLYTTPVNVGDVMRARALCEILESTSSNNAFKKGNFILATPGWTSHAVLKASDCQPAPQLPGGANMTHYLGALGGTGLTAYYGFVEVVSAKKEDVVVVSGAAGATGSMVVQIAKGLVGCKKVIGIAGGAAKCKWVKEAMGADECVDYKAGISIKEQIKKIAPEGVDVYFDNVGGEILDTMLTLLNKNGRISACGAISGYNKDEQDGLKNWFQIIMQRLEVRGFIVTDAVSRPGWAMGTVQKLLAGVQAGTIKLTDDIETVVPTKFDDIPKTWMYLFEGKNQGKLVTKLVD